jgi:predicted CXXCH cytochrome family protein
MRNGFLHSELRVPRFAKWFAGIIFVTFIGFALIATGETSRKHKWLSLFFDGVPDPNAKTNQPAIQYDENGRPLTFDDTPQIILAHTNASTFVSHPPYDDRQCTECHKSRYSPELKAPQKAVCFECHDDFLEKFKFKHQPAENGECNACHDPHGSPHPKMVKAPGKESCMECHDDFSKKVIHQPVENGECTSCHNPHASPFAKLVIKQDAQLCYECHDDFEQRLNKAAFKHDPAANGDCRSCHDPHHSNEKNLLTFSPQKLCFECHEEADIAAVKAHANTGQQSCFTCHDPHFGGGKFFLKPGALKLPAIQPTPAK